MNKNVYYGGFIIVWLLVLTQIGVNIFSVVAGIILSLLWLLVRAAAISGVNQAKGEMYLAKKYDEENNINK